MKALPMSRRIALVEHQRPRILTVDFSDADAAKIKNLGFNVRSGYTKHPHKDQFCIPWAVEDVEVLFARISPDNFRASQAREAHESSVERSPNFLRMMTEVWVRRGWAVLFIEQGCSPKDLEVLGIEHVGVLSYNQRFFPAKEWGKLANALGGDHTEINKISWILPLFKGESVIARSDEPETAILERYIRKAKMSVLAVDYQVEPAWAGTYFSVRHLIRGESAFKPVLAMKLSYGSAGTILLLPDFGRQNVDVAIALLQSVVQDLSPDLFDSPEHPWLESYLPSPVQLIRSRKGEIIAAAQAELDALSKEEGEQLERFNWLLGLLTATGDEFQAHAAEALRFLGFKVDIIDDNVPLGEPRKEDLHISDPEAGFFALGETKGTKRGAAEEFITSIQNHQGRFSREHNVKIPNGILIVNHSYSLDPLQRAGRFYTHASIVSRCKSQGITAVDSVALFQMCQSVLSGEVTAEEIRRYLESDFRVISNFNASELAE